MKTVYFEKVKHMLAEMFAMKKRKAMHPALNVLSFIVTLPFFAAFLVAALMLLGLVILFEVLETPAKYLDEFLTKKGGEVKTATQVVVYFFAWPAVFAIKAMIAFVTLLMNFAYVGTEMLGYVWTLGGVKFHLSILEEGYELGEQETITKGRPLGLIIPGLILIVLVIVSLFLPNILNMMLIPAAGGHVAVQGVTCYTMLDQVLALFAQLMFGVQFDSAQVISLTGDFATYYPVLLAYFSLIVVVLTIVVFVAYVALYVPLAFNNAKKVEKKAK